MKYHKLGTTGLEISTLSLGAMNFGSRINKETSYEILDKAYDLGINFIDTANAYGQSEKIIGEWFAENDTRDDFIISTKVGWPMADKINNKGLSTRHITKQLDRSLELLNTEFIDIYQPHNYNGSNSISRLVKLFSNFIEQSKINIIGAPLFTEAWRVIQWHYEADRMGVHNIGIKEMVFSLLSRGMHKGEILSIAGELNIPIITFGALGGGLLTGKYHSSKEFPTDGKEMFKEFHAQGKVDELVDELVQLAEKYDTSTVHIALAWVLHHDFMSSVILGASSAMQLENIQQVFNIKLNSEEVNRLTELSDQNHIW